MSQSVRTMLIAVVESSARCLSDADFDYVASEAITNDDVSIDVCPLDLALGVLPLTQLALHIWYARHSFRPRPWRHEEYLEI